MRNCIFCGQRLERSNTSSLSLMENMCQTCHTEYVDNNVIVKPNKELDQKVSAVNNGEIAFESTEELLAYLKDSDEIIH